MVTKAIHEGAGGKAVGSGRRPGTRIRPRNVPLRLTGIGPGSGLETQGSPFIVASPIGSGCPFIAPSRRCSRGLGTALAFRDGLRTAVEHALLVSGTVLVTRQVERFTPIVGTKT